MCVEQINQNNIVLVEQHQRCEKNIKKINISIQNKYTSFVNFYLILQGYYIFMLQKTKNKKILYYILLSADVQILLTID